MPQDANKQVTNPQRIIGAKTTIDHVRAQGAKAIVLMSHLGRPDGHRNEKFSLKPIVPEVEKQLGTKITFVSDCVGPEVEEVVNKQTNGGIVLLENLRFHLEEEGKRTEEHPDETKKDGSTVKVTTKAEKADVEKFRQGLTALGDVYISTFENRSVSRNQRLTCNKTMLSAQRIVRIVRWSVLHFLSVRRAR